MREGGNWSELINPVNARKPFLVSIPRYVTSGKTVSSAEKSKIWTGAGLLKAGSLGYLVMGREGVKPRDKSVIQVSLKDFNDQTTLKFLRCVWSHSGNKQANLNVSL